MIQSLTLENNSIIYNHQVFAPNNKAERLIEDALRRLYTILLVDMDRLVPVTIVRKLNPIGGHDWEIYHENISVASTYTYYYPDDHRCIGECYWHIKSGLTGHEYLQETFCDIGILAERLFDRGPI